MFDAPFTAYQRSRGTARVALGPGGRIADLFQQGSAKAMLPRTHGPMPEVVFLNTSGGLTGGDTLSYTLDVAAGLTVCAATQTAERAYASPGGTAAEVRVDLSVGAGATLYWLPQDTILFNHAALDRATEVRLGDGARFLGLETIVLGRAEMGERLEQVDFTDARRVRDSDGRPLHVEQLAIDSAVLADRATPLADRATGLADRATGLANRANPAGLAGASVLATLVWIAPGAGDMIDALRKHLNPNDKSIAASGWDDRLVVRAMGADGWVVREKILPLLRLITGGTLPRVWQL